MNGYFEKGRFIEYGTEKDEWTEKINMVLGHILYEYPEYRKYVGELPIELKDSFFNYPILRFGLNIAIRTPIDTQYSDDYMIEHRIRSNLYELDDVLQKKIFENIKPNTDISNMKVFGNEVYVNRNIPHGIIMLHPDTYGDLLRGKYAKDIGYIQYLDRKEQKY